MKHLASMLVAVLPALVALEQQCFTTDRLTPRSFQWMISRAHGRLILVQRQQQVQ